LRHVIGGAGLGGQLLANVALGFRIARTRLALHLAQLLKQLFDGSTITIFHGAAPWFRHPSWQ